MQLNLVPEPAGMMLRLEKVIFCVLAGQTDFNLSVMDPCARKHPSDLPNYTKMPKTLLFCGCICCCCGFFGGRVREEAVGQVF